MGTPVDVRTLAAFAVTLVLWASAFAGIRAALAGYGPGHLALLRFLVASFVLAAYAVLVRMRLPDRRDLPAVLAGGLAGITIYHLALNYGEVTVTAGAASLLVNSVPVFTALLATAFLGERLGTRGWAGLALSFAGVSLIALGEGEGLRLDPGAGLVLLSAIAQSVYFVIQKPYLGKYRPLEFTAYAIWAGTLFMLAFAPGLAGAVRRAPIEATVAVAYLGVFPAALAYVTWAYALARTEAASAASVLYLVPVLALAIAWIWLAEVPDALSLVGGAMCLAGVVLVGTRDRAGGRRLSRPGSGPSRRPSARRPSRPPSGRA